jgi:hypothetical protein
MVLFTKLDGLGKLMVGKALVASLLVLASAVLVSATLFLRTDELEDDHRALQREIERLEGQIARTRADLARSSIRPDLEQDIRHLSRSLHGTFAKKLRVAADLDRRSAEMRAATVGTVLLIGVLLLAYLQQRGRNAPVSVATERRGREETEPLTATERTAAILRAWDFTRERLTTELPNLRLRANGNLVVGCVIGTLGLFALWRAARYPFEDTTTLVLRFVPRFFLAVSVELFALFFLRLYKATLAEIRLLQNELTNLDAQYAAATTALLESEATERCRALERLTSIHRPRILEKDQTPTERPLILLEKDGLGALDVAAGTILGGVSRPAPTQKS